MKRRAKKAPVKKRVITQSFPLVKVLVVTVLVLSVVFFIYSFHATENYRVLGTSTLLAKSDAEKEQEKAEKEAEKAAEKAEKEKEKEKKDNSGSSALQIIIAPILNLIPTAKPAPTAIPTVVPMKVPAAVPNTNTVVCNGPDDKKVVTTVKECQELNAAWNKPATYLPINVNPTMVKPKPKFEISEDPNDPTPIPQAGKPDSTIQNLPGIWQTTNKGSNQGKQPTKTQNTQYTYPQSQDQQQTQPEFQTESQLDFPSEGTFGEPQVNRIVPESERIRTVSKDGTEQFDITSGEIKTRLEIVDNKVVVKVEQADGTEIELPEEVWAKVEQRLAKDNIAISSVSANKFLVKKGNVGAITNYPITLNLVSNAVYVNTPTGQRTVAILPEQAVISMIDADIITRVRNDAVVNDVIRTNVPEVGQLVSLDTINGIPVYRVNGISEQNLVGLFPVKIEKNIIVSAESGNAVSINQSFTSKFLDILSF